MSNSDVLLEVLASDMSSEVMVVDGNFRVLARGIQRVQLHVQPGIYRAKARVGSQQNETLFSVEPTDTHKTVQLDPLEFASPIPLAQTSTTHEYHQSAISAAVSGAGGRAQFGTGSQLVIFLRDPSDVYFNLDMSSLEAYARSFDGFSLCDWDGQNAHALRDIGEFQPQNGYLIVSAQVNPGAYALSRPHRGDGHLFLPLVVPAGWSLRAYVTMEDVPGTQLTRQANFDEAAMVLDRLDAPFGPFRPDLKVLEVARHALARGHNMLDEASMSRLLTGKFENPMMGVIAAHLLLLDKQPNLQLAQTVIDNTSKLIGANYPDLLALSYRMRALQPKGAAIEDANVALTGLKAPPMLQMSWHYLMDAWRRVPTRHTPKQDEPFGLANRLVSSSVWLSWEDSPGFKEDKPAYRLGGTGVFSTRLEDIRAHLSSYVSYARDILTSAKDATFRPDTGTSPESTQRIFKQIASTIDWLAVVRILKTAEAGRNEPRLSPIQRQLVLALKAAREQLIDDGELSPDLVKRWLLSTDAPLQVLEEELTRLATLAKDLIAKSVKSGETPTTDEATGRADGASG